MSNTSVKPPQPWPIRSFTLTVVLALLNLGWLSVTACRGYRFVAVQLGEIVRMDELRGQIILLDEVLTMSVWMAAATGDLQWETRYRQFEPKLAAALKEAMYLAPAVVGSQAAVQTDTANTQLVAMEEHLLELVSQGQQIAAQQLVNSTNYKAAKRSFANGMAKISLLLAQSTESLQQTRKVELLWSVSIAAVAATMLGLSWWIVLRAMRRWGRAMMDNHQHLTRQAAELRDSELRFRELFDDAPIGYHELDAQGHIIGVNRKEVQLLGYTVEEMLGHHVSEFAFDPASAMEMVRGKLSGRLPVSQPYELEYRRKDGSKLPALLNDRLNQDIHGQTIGMRTSLQDNTERKQAVKTITRLATAVEQSSETIVITDTNGTILYVNPAFEQISGYSRAEAIGQNPSVLKSGKHNAEFYRQMWDVLKRGEVWHGRFTNRRKDGALYEEDATISPVRDSAGKTIEYLAVKRDVTREVRLEVQFRQAQKMDAIGQLAGGVAHDFNNILAALMMGLELLCGKENLDRETTLSLKELGHETRRAADLTRQLLIFSRRSVPEVTVLDLNDVVANLLKMLGRLLGEHITLTFERRKNLPAVEADAGMLEQVLMNLVVNARDAMPRGGQITLALDAVDFDSERIAANRDRRAGRFVCLTVADTGCGMDAATLTKIFEPFFTTKAAGKGTGLGLATVCGIVAQHGGWVEVESKADVGTTFRIYLPVSAKAAAKAETEEAKLPAIPHGQETLLVVEDDAGVRLVLVQSLRMLGYRVFAAANGHEAMNFWRNHSRQIDLLLTDMVMPEGMTGLELAERVKAEKPHLKVIISSGYSTALTESVNATTQGFVYLPKPYEVSHLETILRRCLDPQDTLS